MTSPRPELPPAVQVCPGCAAPTPQRRPQQLSHALLRSQQTGSRDCAQSQHPPATSLAGCHAAGFGGQGTVKGGQEQVAGHNIRPQRCRVSSATSHLRTACSHRAHISPPHPYRVHTRPTPRSHPRTHLVHLVSHHHARHLRVRVVQLQLLHPTGRQAGQRLTPSHIIHCEGGECRDEGAMSSTTGTAKVSGQQDTSSEKGWVVCKKMCWSSIIVHACCKAHRSIQPTACVSVFCELVPRPILTKDDAHSAPVKGAGQRPEALLA